MADKKQAKDAAAEGEPKKKKSKLPLILIVVLVLGGGGFFGMKAMKGPEKEPEIALGEVVSLGEFLVNIGSGGQYLSTEIFVQLAEGESLSHGEGGGHGGGGEGVDPAMVPLRDAVIGVIASSSMQELQAADRTPLKIKIAEAINAAVEAGHHEEEGKDAKKDEHKDEHAEEDEASEEEGEPKHPDWHSQEGPVLKVYFNSYAWQ